MSRVKSRRIPKLTTPIFALCLCSEDVATDTDLPWLVIRPVLLRVLAQFRKDLGWFHLVTPHVVASPE